MDYLNKGEMAKLVIFNEDEIMREAVKKVLVAGIYYTGVLNKKTVSSDKNWAYNLGASDKMGGEHDFLMEDAKLGSLLKITTRALSIVESAFSKLSEFNKDEPQKEEDNPAV